MKRLLAPLFLLVLLVGCGGGGGDIEATVTSSTATHTHTLAVPRSPASHSSSRLVPPSSPPRPRGLLPTDARALSNEGTKAIAPGVPTVRHGDNSIQSYGLESSGDERAQAATIAKQYLDDQAAGHWGHACSLLDRHVRSNLESFIRRLAAEGPPDCSTAMRYFLRGVPVADLRTVADISILSFRVDGSQAFLIYRDGEGAPAELHMLREGGPWLIGALVGNELILHA